MPGAWDDDRPRAEDGFAYDAPLGANAVEELEHELALAAALDRSRHSLSPDEQASARMRRRLFEAMAEEGFSRMEQEQDATRRPAPAPGPSELTAPLGAPPIVDTSGPATRPVGPPVPEMEPNVPAASVGRAAGEHTISASEKTGVASRSRSRARHVLPDDHPDHLVEASHADRDRSRPPGKPTGRRRRSVRRRFGVLVTCVAALAVLAGIAATASKNALPGDALYGVKRATESTGGLFTFGDQAEATQQLEVARTRMDEVQGLLQSGSAPDSAAITTAMNDFNTATATGSRMMLSADRTGGANSSQLADLRTWATAQNDRMAEMQSSWPEANASDAEESKTLLDRVLTRTEALRARTGLRGRRHRLRRRPGSPALHRAVRRPGRTGGLDRGRAVRSGGHHARRGDVVAEPVRQQLAGDLDQWWDVLVRPVVERAGARSAAAAARQRSGEAAERRAELPVRFVDDDELRGLGRAASADHAAAVAARARPGHARLSPSAEPSPACRSGNRSRVNGVRARPAGRLAW